jgi:hypothetical protein
LKKRSPDLTIKAGGEIMLRNLLVLMLLTTPCFGQGLGNMASFAGMGRPWETIQNYGNAPLPYGQLNYNFGNNPNVYTLYRPQVSDYLTPDPRQLKAYSNPLVKPGQHFLMRRNVNFNQFNYNQPIN